MRYKKTYPPSGEMREREKFLWLPTSATTYDKEYKRTVEWRWLEKTTLIEEWSKVGLGKKLGWGWHIVGFKTEK